VKCSVSIFRAGNDNLKTMLYEIAPEYKVKIFEETGMWILDMKFPGIRFRVNFFNQKNALPPFSVRFPPKSGRLRHGKSG